MYSMSVSTTRTYILMHHINNIHTCSMLASNTHASHQQPSLFFICFCYQQLQTNPPSSSPPPFFWPLILTQPPTSVTIGSFCHWLCILFTWRSLQKQNNRAQGCVAIQAWRGAEACPLSIRKELSKGQRRSKWRSQAGNRQASQPGTGKHAQERAIDKPSQAENWQSIPCRDCKTCPGRALANLPRQGTGKRPQAGNWQASPGRDFKHAQAWTASMPRQGMHTGKRFKAGNWQAFPGRELASVPGAGPQCAEAGHRQMFPGMEP